MSFPSPPRIELLYFDGCPNHEPLKALLEAELAAASLAGTADVEYINVSNHQAAQTHRFLGSPSLRVNGVDVEPAVAAAEAAGSIDYGYRCRIYNTPDGPAGVPSAEWVREALRAAVETGGEIVPADCC